MDRQQTPFLCFLNVARVTAAATAYERPLFTEAAQQRIVV
jgi:hypothetical protein